MSCGPGTIPLFDSHPGPTALLALKLRGPQASARSLGYPESLVAEVCTLRSCAVQARRDAAVGSLLFEVVDGEGLDVIARTPEPKHARVEVELRVERILDVLGFAESMLLAFVHLEGGGDALLQKGLVHHLCLVGWHDLVFVSL
eukprot:CAMPEP_0181215650 /NCGR_PEP_ID=MMETSP1096-20121128/26130_1 /TAXON_ID=156174 ORGANISM="Chrysochromulina ericina, Strain CCMP281" /NCGR_SAMPLE_ID=MMETSP1096 /ASSEMBLY_ACC=CAM_ASM_000453 /LENGTH=143 /DNA_ID=CAMNT_0023307527 /DNA_START=231 /DNA_END=663 /DNA_ORIENTATION=+